MAPALTAEPLSPKEKLTSTASPATGTRQSVRKLESPSGGGGIGNGSDTAKKSTTATISATTEAAIVASTGAATVASVATTTTTRVTRSKDAAQRIGSPVVQVPANNKRKSNNSTHNNNNNNNGCSIGSSGVSEVKLGNDQMGLSAATTHTSTDGSAASTSSSSSSNSGSAASDATVAAATQAVVPAAVVEEHNNNCKDNSTAELLANLTNDFEEAITAEICLRKTLPEVSLSKEQPGVAAGAAAADPAQLVEPMSMAEAHTQSSTSSAAAATATLPVLPQPQPPSVVAPVTESPRLLEQHEGFPGIVINSSSSGLQRTSVPVEDDVEIPDNIEERLSQLDGTPVALPPIVNINATTLEAGVALPTTHSVQEQEQPPQEQSQPQQDILASPQHSAVRQPGAVLTPQSTASSINFLKDGAAGAVLEDQDIEEVLKALKNLDGSQVNPDTICDFNFFNEVCFLNNEEETAAAAGAGASTTAPEGSSSSSLVAHTLNVEESSAKATCSSVMPSWQECHAELEQQQCFMLRKADFLLRRMRKFQVRQMCRHASDEVAGILEWSARFSNKAAPAAPVRSAKLTEQEDTVLSIVSGRPGNSFWEEQTKQPLPATQMSNVIRHIEAAARKQQICHTIGGGSASLASSSSWYSNAAQPGKRSRKLQPIDAISNSSTDAIVMPRADEIVPNYDSYVTSELTHVAGLLHTEMREVQNAIDSDATESSSGGESADEMVNYNNSQQLSLPITRRAVWRYSRDRAAIALRWSWLCGQVADLDMKIRQHNDVYNDLTRTKGDVLLESTAAPKNGYKEAQPQSQSSAERPGDELEQQQPVDWLCSRTRPLVLSEFRKRKLFQTINMHTISKKAARPSNIKCGCQWPQVPCTLCTGRPDPTAPRDLPETLMPQNRVALLDASYHPVLSFTDDVCQSLHLEAISRQPDWQYRVMRSQAKAIVKGVWKAERDAIALSGGVSGAGGAGRRPGETVKRRYVRRKERNNNNNNNNNSISNRSSSNNNNNNNSNINNNNNKESTTTTPIQSGAGGGGGGGGGIVGLDSGNAAAKRQRQSAKTIGDGSLSSPLSDPQQQQQLQEQLNQQNNPSVISSGNGNGAKKSRKSASKQRQQQQKQHSAHNTNNNHNNTSNSQQTIGGDSTARFPADSQWEQPHSRRSSAENHGHRNERTAERRSRLIYDIDNIVIPYSMAAQTRVEILPYKEIPTPKWRIVDSDNKKKQKHSTDEKQSNGCVNQAEVETESTLSLTAAKATTATEVTTTTSPTATATSSATTTATSIATTTATSPATTTATSSATTTATSPATTATPKEKQETVSKVNGLKHSSKKRALPEPDKQPEQKLSNGLVNGDTQPKSAPAKEQPKQPTTINGKIKRNNNKISVKCTASASASVSAPAPVAAAAPTSAADIAAKELLIDAVEPPKKRPKLQLKEKANSATPPQAKTLKPIAMAAVVDDEEIEDISDEAYILRHQRALIEEQRRFEAYLRLPWSTRSRANRRVDSRAESSGANTPDPSSPANPQLTGPVGVDNESIPSPLAQTMLQNPLDAVNADGELTATGTTKGKRQERRRTTSSKLKDQDRRSATPDTREFPQLPLDPPPFEPLQFPLSKEVYQRLLAEMNIEPKAPRLSLPVTVTAKRTKSKSVSSNGGDANTTTTTNSGSRRSSKAKATNASKLAQTTTTTMPQRLNGGKNTQRTAAQLNGGKDQQSDADGIDYRPEDEEEEEEDELLLEEDDDYHYLAPPPEDEQLPAGVGDDANLYDASIDAYLGEQEGLDEEELADDPFMDDDPNDPEWKRSIGVRHERLRKRV